MESFSQPVTKELADFIGCPKAAGKPFPCKNQSGSLRSRFQRHAGHAFTQMKARLQKARSLSPTP